MNENPNTDSARRDGRSVFKELKAALLAQNFRALALAAFIAVYAATFFSTRRRRRSQVTGQNETNHLRRLQTVCEIQMNKIPVPELTEHDVETICEALEDAFIPGTTEHYSNGAYNCSIGALGRILKFLSKPPWSLVTEQRLNAMVEVISSYWADPQVREFKLPSPQEERIMIEYAERQCGHGETRLHSLVIFLLFIYFGIRPGSCELIVRGDVDFAKNEITITFNKKRDGRVIRAAMAMPVPLRNALEELLSKTVGIAEEPLLEVCDISKLIASAAKAAGLPHFTPRGFRKLFITRCLQAGIDIPTVAFLVGHEDGGRSIEKNYSQFCNNHASNALRKVHARIDQSGTQTEDRKNQQYWAEQDIAAIAEAAPDSLWQKFVRFMRRVAEKIQLHDEQAAENLLAVPDEGLPKRPSYANPILPQSIPLSEVRLKSANLRTLMWRDGIGNNELVAPLGLASNAVSFILNGKSQTDENLQKLADHFKVTLAYFRDKTVKRYDTDLVIDNVIFLAKRYGLGRLPCAASVANISAGRHLPTGDVLKALAEFANISLEKLLTTDVSEHPDLPPIPVILSPEEEKLQADNNAVMRRNVSEHIEVHLLRKGLKRTAAAAKIGIRANQFDSYAAGRHLPDDDKLQLIATYFGVTSEELKGPAFQLNKAAITGRIASLLKPTNLATWRAAQLIQMAPAKLEQILLANELPDGPQLHRIANFLNATPDMLLGYPGPSATAPKQGSVNSENGLSEPDIKIAA